jgi:S1-C subfamily serine protease
MRKRSALVALALVYGVASAAVAQPTPPAAPPPPPAPEPPAAPAAGGTPAPASAPAAPPAAEVAPAPARPGPAGLENSAEVRQGVVLLERGGRALGQGAVLRSDGRILSSLTPLGHGNFIQARFADNSLLPVRVVASDRAWDLALLAPSGGHWTLGLRPSSAGPAGAGAALHRYRTRGGRLEETSVGLAGRQTLLGRDGAMLGDALVLSGRLNDDELGSALFDDLGEVAAIVVQACAPGSAQSCQLGTFGAPVSALKQFLRKAPPREPLPAAWLGVHGVAAHDGSVAGVRVISVDVGSPAAQAGLRADAGARTARSSSAPEGDLIVAVQDAPVTTPDEMRDAINRFALTSEPRREPEEVEKSDRMVRLLVFGSGKFREVSLPLRPPQTLPSPASTAPAKAGGALTEPAAPSRDETKNAAPAAPSAPNGAAAATDHPK